MLARSKIYSISQEVTNKRLILGYFKFTSLVLDLMQDESELWDSSSQSCYKQNGPFFEDVAFALAYSKKGYVGDLMIFEFLMKSFRYLQEECITLELNLNAPELYLKFIQGKNISNKDIIFSNEKYLFKDTCDPYINVRKINDK